MKAIRFLLLTIHAPAKPFEGLPTEEGQAFATAWTIPAQYALREGFLAEQSLGALLEAPNRAKASECAVSLWSAQQALCEKLGIFGIDSRGLPPISGRALEAFCLPSGIFWVGAYCPCESLAHSQDGIGKALCALFGQPAKKSRTLPFPWLGEFSRSAAWALGANQAFASQFPPATPPP